jgi:hypothetical protein
MCRLQGIIGNHYSAFWDHFLIEPETFSVVASCAGDCGQQYRSAERLRFLSGPHPYVAFPTNSTRRF